jgi:hypothetical protein
MFSSNICGNVNPTKSKGKLPMIKKERSVAVRGKTQMGMKFVLVRC